MCLLGSDAANSAKNCAAAQARHTSRCIDNPVTKKVSWGRCVCDSDVILCKLCNVMQSKGTKHPRAEEPPGERGQDATVDPILARFKVGDDEVTEAAVLDTTIFPLCDVIATLVPPVSAPSTAPKPPFRIDAGEQLRIATGTAEVWYAIMLEHIPLVVFDVEAGPEEAIRVQVPSLMCLCGLSSQRLCFLQQWLDKPRGSTRYKLLSDTDDIPLVSVLGYGMQFSVKTSNRGSWYTQLPESDVALSLPPHAAPSIPASSVPDASGNVLESPKAAILSSFTRGLTVRAVLRDFCLLVAALRVTACFSFVFHPETNREGSRQQRAVASTCGSHHDCNRRGPSWHGGAVIESAVLPGCKIAGYSMSLDVEWVQ